MLLFFNYFFVIFRDLKNPYEFSGSDFTFFALTAKGLGLTYQVWTI